MSTTSRVAGAVAAGYALGRFKKLRLAVLVATAMSSPKFRAAAADMLQDRLPGGAITGTLTKEVGGKLVNVGKTAATSIVASRIDSLSQSLADRSENLRKAAPGGQADKSPAEEPADEYEEQEGEEAEEPTDEYEEQEGEEAEEPTDEYEEQEDEEAEEPTDEYEEQEDEEAEEPTDEYEEQEDEEAEEPTEESEEQEASQDEQPEEPVARSPRRRRSASPAGRRRG
jgi:cobalamin biosynthesis protein CobT